MRKLTLVTLIAVLAFVLAGCYLTVTQNVRGSGQVALSQVELNGQEGLPGTAGFSLNFSCNDRANTVQGTMSWRDPTNRVRFSATLPRTSVSVLTNGQFATCAEMRAAAANLGFSANMACIFSEDGNADGDYGTQTGMAEIVVSQPGVGDPTCVGTSTVAVWAENYARASSFQYLAEGCLNRGQITFSSGTGGQNQQ